MMLSRVRLGSRSILLGALLGLGAACGGEDDTAPRALSSSDGGTGSLTIPGRQPSPPAPLQPESRDPAVTSLSPPRLGRDESRGHTGEAGRAGQVGEPAPAVPDDLACGYVCRGFAACFPTSASTGTCPVCESTVRVRPECRPRFESGVACLQQFGPQICENPKEFGNQFLSICGFPVGSNECFQGSGR
jgi:hypothetical protein